VLGFGLVYGGANAIIWNEEQDEVCFWWLLLLVQALLVNARIHGPNNHSSNGVVYPPIRSSLTGRDSPPSSFPGSCRPFSQPLSPSSSFSGLGKLSANLFWRRLVKKLLQMYTLTPLPFNFRFLVMRRENSYRLAFYALPPLVMVTIFIVLLAVLLKGVSQEELPWWGSHVCSYHGICFIFWTWLLRIKNSCNA
jgi:hypothetical protein